MTRHANDAEPPEWIDAGEAAGILGVRKETLYSYVSRGLVRSASRSPQDRERVYQRGDIERLRARSLARSGHTAVAAGALRWGDPVLETSIGSIDARGPWYRGASAIDMAMRGVAFEDVCTRLWEAPAFPSLPKDERKLGVPAAAIKALMKTRAEPFDAMLLAASAFAASEPRVEASLEIAKVRATALHRRLIAASGLALGKGGDKAVSASLAAAGAAKATLVALGGKTTDANVSAMREALIVTADHELNASTFAARVAASSGASMPASMLAALATLSGPRHGAATARVEAFAAEVGSPEKAATAVRQRLDRGEAVPGFGHPLYPTGDPRGARLLDVALRAGGKSKNVKVLSSIVSSMQLVARDQPTVDFALVAVCAAMGLGQGAALAVFASARIAGWIAHVLEQRAAGFLLRPRARYVGVPV